MSDDMLSATTEEENMVVDYDCGQGDHADNDKNDVVDHEANTAEESLEP